MRTALVATIAGLLVAFAALEATHRLEKALLRADIEIMAAALDEASEATREAIRMVDAMEGGARE